MKQYIYLISLLIFSQYSYANQLENGGFEDGFNNWNVSFIDTGNTYSLDTNAPFAGTTSLCLDIQQVNPNWWENQFYYFSTGMTAETSYEISFYAKNDTGAKQVNISLLDNVNYSSYLDATISLSEDWEKYTFLFSTTSGANDIGMYINVGFETGIFCFDDFTITAQCNLLVWEENFDGNTLNSEKWTKIIGPGFNYNEPQYFTDSPNNFEINNGIAKFIAKEEQIMGFDYSSSGIKSEDKYYWTYGKFEARMKMPIGQGLWPAFWLLYQNSEYGPWPVSGEIDIMEYLGSSTSQVHAAVHYGNSGYTHNESTMSYIIPADDLTSDFHTYAIEWDKDKIVWYLDGVQYHQFLKSSVPETDIYPFDIPFYIILNLSLGGWEGMPDASTPFPATFEVDYVKVSQRLEDIIVYSQPTYTFPNQQSLEIYAPEIVDATYNWVIPSSYEIISGQGTSSIIVNVGNQSESVQLELSTPCGDRIINHQVITDINLCDNGDFENGFGNWYYLFSDASNFGNIDEQNTYEGDFSACFDIVNPSAPNWWEDHMVYYNTGMTENNTYTISFYAKADAGNKQIYVAVQDNENYTEYAGNNFYLTAEWTQFSFDISPPAGANNLGLYFNIGFEQGIFCFDNVSIENQTPNASASIVKGNFHVYPNPAKDFVVINSPIPNYNIKVMDSTGVQVLDDTANSASHVLNMKMLPSGIYFLLIEDINGTQVSLQKVVIE